MQMNRKQVLQVGRRAYRRIDAGLAERSNLSSGHIQVRELSGRVANIVPIDDVEMAIRSVNAYTQTIGVYPDKLKEEVRDRLGLHGAQRVVSLGLALSTMLALPQDAIEPLRRMCRWVACETGRPDNTTSILAG